MNVTVAGGRDPMKKLLLKDIGEFGWIKRMRRRFKSGRAVVEGIGDDALDALLRDWPSDRALFFADEEGGSPAAEACAAHPGPSAIVIGPEGGFDAAERAAIRALPQARPISLGPRILRGETAAIAALSVWMALAGDWARGESERD